MKSADLKQKLSPQNKTATKPKPKRDVQGERLRKLLEKRYDLEVKIQEQMQRQHKTLSEKIELIKTKLDKQM